jgi:hypothetical protein
MNALQGADTHLVVRVDHAAGVRRTQRGAQQREHREVVHGRFADGVQVAEGKVAQAALFERCGALPRAIKRHRAAQHACRDAAHEVPQQALLEHCRDARIANCLHLFDVVLACEQHSVHARVSVCTECIASNTGRK